MGSSHGTVEVEEGNTATVLDQGEVRHRSQEEGGVTEGTPEFICANMNKVSMKLTQDIACSSAG